MVLLDNVANEQTARIRRSFAQGEAWGVLRLAISELGTRLSPGLAPLQALGCAYLERLCTGSRRHRNTRLELEPEAIASIPLDPVVARRIWNDLGATLELELHARGENVGQWILRAAACWDEVGRVAYHLAERPLDAHDPDRERPFRFFASFGMRVGVTPRVRFVPLGRAVREASRRSSFVHLTAPVFWAAERNVFVRSLYDGGRHYDTLAWTPEEALEFVEAVPTLVRAGVLVRMPASPPRATPVATDVRLRIGERSSVLTRSALLDFSIEVALGGETLTEDELHEILSSKGRLVSIRGKWVAIDRQGLEDRIERWKGVSQVTAAEGLQLLSGVKDDVVRPDELGLDGSWRLPPEPGPPHFVAGRALAATFHRLARPDPGEADPGPALGTQLRGYQKTGVAWLWQLQRLGLGGCLADDMGLGKTVQVLALLLLMKRDALGPTLLVAPASLLANWKAEAARFAPGLRVAIAHSSAGPREGARGEREGADLVITTYGSLRRQSALTKRRWRLVVLDEAQAIKNPSSRQARTVKTLESDTRLALTGTPVENGLEDLWSIFDFVNPGLLGTRREFAAACERLAGRRDAEASGSDDRYEPLRRLVRPYVLRRCKTDRSLLPELPDKTEVKAWCTLTRTQAALYQQTVDGLARALEAAEQASNRRRAEQRADSMSGMARRGLVLATLVRLKQICNHPSQWLGDGVYDPTASGKLLRLRELCAPIALAGERVLVFTQFREMTGPLADCLTSVFGRRGLVLSGETDIAERRELVEAFQAPDGPPSFVLSLRAGGTGLTLTAASHVIHFDRWWNPAVENQATDRAYRIGQKRNVLVHKLICRGTVEERVDELIESKRSLASSVVESGGELLLTELDREQLLALVSLDARTALDHGREA